ncbi:sugar ABC transporter permease, partial [Rhizobium leguminosarum]|nr:sugar ABC transporter permease [Rhizobium leguminosarum]
MMKSIENDPAAPALLDRRDERVRHDDSFGGSIQAFWDRIRSG